MREAPWSSGVDSRQTRPKYLVVIAAEDEGSPIGRIRLAYIPAGTRERLFDFPEKAIASGAVVHTNGLRAYRGMEKLKFTHALTKLHDDPESASVSCPRCIGFH